MQNLNLIWPYAAFLFLLTPMIIWLSLHTEREVDFLRTSIAATIQDKIFKVSKKKLNRSWLLPVFIWCGLVFALMRPSILEEPLSLNRKGRNLLLAVDISESMEASDMQIQGQHVNRLTAVKHVLSKFIENRPGDRLGLVVFGSETFLHAPLSFDHKTITKFLLDAQIGFAGPKTAIGDAIGLATKKLLEQTEGERVLILLTDGQNNIGALDPMKAASIAKEHSIKIYTVGIGAYEMSMPGFFGPTTINPSRDLEAGEEVLKEISSMTGGRYFRGKDVNSLTSIYEELDKLEPSQNDPMWITPKKELFFWPLGITFLTLLMILIFKNVPFSLGRL